MESNSKTEFGGVEISIVILAAILVASCIVVASIIIDQEHFTAVEASSIIRNYGLLALGCVGFPLAIWRSWVAHMQTQEAIEQGRRVERQIQATELNNLTIQIDKAATLIADEKRAKQQGGVALARYIGMHPLGDFGQEALDLLTGFLKREKDTISRDQLDVTAMKYADTIASRLERNDRCDVTFQEIDIDYVPSKLRGITFVSCNFIELEIGRANKYINCNFIDCKISGSVNFLKDCQFLECTINSIAMVSREQASFNYCDFSGCKKAANVTKDMLNECFYVENRPPADIVLKRLGAVLNVEKTNINDGTIVVDIDT